MRCYCRLLLLLLLLLQLLLLPLLLLLGLLLLLALLLLLLLHHALQTHLLRLRLRLRLLLLLRLRRWALDEAWQRGHRRLRGCVLLFLREIRSGGQRRRRHLCLCPEHCSSGRSCSRSRSLCSLVGHSGVFLRHVWKGRRMHRRRCIQRHRHR
jgi:hypothetical protein